MRGTIQKETFHEGGTGDKVIPYREFHFQYGEFENWISVLQEEKIVKNTKNDTIQWKFLHEMRNYAI